MNKQANKLVRRAESLEREASKLRETIQAMSDLVDEPELDGSVVRFSKRFEEPVERLVANDTYRGPYDYSLHTHSVSRQYDYAAIRSGNHWFVSGPKDGARRFTWNQLLDFIGENYWDTLRVLEHGRGN